MKLRNKKTSEIYEIVFCPLKEEWKETDENRLLVIRDCNKPWKKNIYKTLAELNEEWEDYKPKEPLIKDEKIRKAVKAWAEANEFESDMPFAYDKDGICLCCWQASIEFNSRIDGLEDGKEYTISELCGEEE